MLKKFILSVALILSAPAFAADDAAIVKMFDGKFARCQAEGDLNHRAYLPDSLSAKAEAGSLSVVFILRHFQCSQTREGYGWETAPRPLEPVADRDLSGNPILIKLAQSQAVLVRAAEASLLSAVELENAAEQKIHFAAGIDSLLTSEQLSALHAGGAVDARAAFFIRSLVSVEDSQGRNIPLGQRAGGAYSILLRMKRNQAGEIQVVSLELK